MGQEDKGSWEMVRKVHRPSPRDRFGMTESWSRSFWTKINEIFRPMTICIPSARLRG
jgi:hypothetical protein